MFAKRTLDELALRYRLGKVDSREIFVEGIQDKVILDHLLEVRGVRAAVYTADTIEMPNILLTSRGLTAPSSRSIVIATKDELMQRNVDISEHLFIVDRDQEDLIATPCINGCDATDFGSLLVHLVDEKSLRRLIVLAGRGLVAYEVFEYSIYSISRNLYLIRSAAKRISLPLRMLSPSPFIVRDKGTGMYGLAIDNYIKSCLHSCDLICRENDLRNELDSCRSELDALRLDPRVCVNDHELWVIIRSILKDAGDPVNRSADDVRDLFLMSFDPEKLADTPLFRKILHSN